MLKYDAAELRAEKEDAIRIRGQIDSIIEYLEGFGLVSAQDSAEDALREVCLYIEELDAMICAANREEEQQELREYYNAVM